VADEDVRNLIFQYDLDIIPILMKFDSHAELKLPIEGIDREALGKWFDDRIISFVKSYLAVHQNNYYLKDHLVEDPIAKVRFPKFAAGAKLDWKGKTIYFLGEETRREFEQQQGAAK
jgi:YHS domain-containing protein